MAIAPQIDGRDETIDIAKAILIVLMLIGHQRVGQRLNQMIYSFHMMAFVFFAGYCFKPVARENLKNAIGKRCRTLLLPYFMWGVGYILLNHYGVFSELKTVLGAVSFTKTLFTDIPSVGPVYFIPMLFVIWITYVFIRNCGIGEKKYAIHAIVLCISLVGGLLGKLGYWLPWSIDCAWYALVFYHIGYCFKKYRVLENICCRYYLYFPLAIVWMYMMFSGGMELATRTYGTYSITLLGAISATVILYMLCGYLYRNLNSKLRVALTLIGRNTLYILLFHTLLGAYVGTWLSELVTPGYIYHFAALVVFQLVGGVALGVAVEGINKWMLKTIRLR